MARSDDGKAAIGFVGLGQMGGRMARRLLDAGHDLTAFDRDPGHVTALAGARPAATPREAAAGAEVVLVSVPDDDALFAVLRGDDGLLAGARPGTVVLDTSTVSPGASVRAAGEARALDVVMLDAAVSGSTPEAEKGELVVLVGGDGAAFERVRPVLDVLGKTAFHVGPEGHGSVMKLVVNGIMGVGLQAVAEGLAFGVKAGLDRARALEVLDAVAVVSPHHKRKLKENAATGAFLPQFPTGLMAKDLCLLQAHAFAVGASVPAAAAAAQVVNATLAHAPDTDYSATFETMTATNGGR